MRAMVTIIPPRRTLSDRGPDYPSKEILSSMKFFQVVYPESLMANEPGRSYVAVHACEACRANLRANKPKQRPLSLKVRSPKVRVSGPTSH